MENHVLKTFEKVFDLIPLIQKTTRECIKQDWNKIPHNASYIKEERDKLKELFNLIQGKWTLEIIYTIWVLRQPRFNEIKKTLLGIGSRVLTDRLKLLEKKGFVIRIIHNTHPIRVSYKLSEFGEGFYLILVPVFLYFLFTKK